MRALAGRTAVVTGAASGIGRALAGRCAAEGMKVVLADVERDALDRAVADLHACGAEAIGVRCDVSRAADVEALAAAALDAFGAVHLLCNNAGVESGTLFCDISQATWDWVLGVDLLGVLHGCRVFLPLLREQDEAHIVNTGSLASLDAGMVTAAPYVVAKFAVLGLSENLHHELAAAGETVGISVVLPGMVDTNMPTSERNRPAGVPATDDDPARDALHEFTRTGGAAGVDPADVAAAVLDAVRERRFYVLPHREAAIDAVERRLRWMAAARGARSRCFTSAGVVSVVASEVSPHR
jgi:NAD(P)-dependent dehydrogenase (short-subunit alcohol dehydrogenase family)